LRQAAFGALGEEGLAMKHGDNCKYTNSKTTVNFLHCLYDFFFNKNEGYLLKSQTEGMNRSNGPAKVHFDFLDCFLLAVAVLALLYGRWSSIIFPISLNPDEVQAAANTLRILNYGFNWDSLDGTTVGPLNSIILMWPKIIGLDVTLSFVRLTAFFILSLIFIVVYLSIQIFLDRWAAVFCSAPLVFFYAYTKSPEFLHYSSELLPVLILCIANFFIISILHNPQKLLPINIFFIGVLLGSAPFAKLQATPIAFFIGIFALLLIVYHTTTRKENIFSLLVGSLIVPAIFFVPLIISGNLSHFWYSYIVWAGVYVKESTSILGIHGMIASDDTLRVVIYFLFSLLIFCSLSHRLVDYRRVFSGRKYGVGSLYSFIILMVALWAISKPGNPFPHYLMFFPPFFIIFLAYSLRFYLHSFVQRIVFLVAYVVFSFASFYSLAYDAGEFNFNRKSHATVLKKNFQIELPNILAWLPSTNDSLLVWGWMPQWYLLSSRVPATRESHTFSQIVPSKLSNYFRSRFLLDFDRSNPDFVIDAVKGASFGFNDPSKYSPYIFPEFRDILKSRYNILSSLKGNNACPDLYIRNDLKASVLRNLIIPKSVVASETYGGSDLKYSPRNLFDNSVMEDSCADFWLLPDKKNGFVNISLNQSESISKILILNTQNGVYLDRSAGDVIVKLKSNDFFVEHKITLRPYPFWTVIELDEDVVVDAIEINVISYNGLGGGLNEVKLFRRLP
jgi:hypothetical protein